MSSGNKLWQFKLQFAKRLVQYMFESLKIIRRPYLLRISSWGTGLSGTFCHEITHRETHSAAPALAKSSLQQSTDANFPSTNFLLSALACKVNLFSLQNFKLTVFFLSLVFVCFVSSVLNFEFMMYGRNSFRKM